MSNKKPGQRRPSSPNNPSPAAAGLPPGVSQAQQAQQVADLHSFVRGQIESPAAALEKLRGHPVISYVLTGAQLADEQMLHLYEHLRRLGKQDHLSLFLSSRGGATEVPWKIISLIRSYTKKFSVLVPYQAHSAATLTALGADEIVMTPMSELGPIDPIRAHPLIPLVEAP